MTDLDKRLGEILRRAGVSKGIHRIIGSGKLDGNNRLSTQDTLTEATHQINQIIDRAVIEGKKETLRNLNNILDAHLHGDYAYSGTDARTALENWRKELKKEL